MISSSKLLRASFAAQQKEVIPLNPKLYQQLINVFGAEFINEFELVPPNRANIHDTNYFLTLGINDYLYLCHKDLKKYPNRFSTNPIIKLGDLHRTMTCLEKHNN